jgi:hypothetical protein
MCADTRSAPVPAVGAWSRYACCALLWLMPSLASAQIPALPSSQLGWDMAAVTKAVADLHSYSLSVDGGAYTPLASVVCSAGSPVTCRAPLPAMTVGPHVLLVRSRLGGVDSPSAAPLDIVVVVVVSPSNVRIEAQP